MKNDNKTWDELKPLLVFTTSGGLAKLHKEFMEPSSDVYPIHNQVHHGFHFLIGTGIQIILCLWLLKIIVTIFLMPVFSFFVNAYRNMAQNGKQPED